MNQLEMNFSALAEDMHAQAAEYVTPEERAEIAVATTPLEQMRAEIAALRAKRALRASNPVVEYADGASNLATVSAACDHIAPERDEEPQGDQVAIVGPDTETLAHYMPRGRGLPEFEAFESLVDLS